MSERLDLTEESSVCWEGSWGATPRVNTVMRITAWADSERGLGGFEVYDVESGGDWHYGSGGMWFDDNGYISDYDGCASLDHRIIEWLDTLGMVDPDPTCWFRKEITPKEMN